MKVYNQLLNHCRRQPYLASSVFISAFTPCIFAGTSAVCVCEGQTGGRHHSSCWLVPEHTISLNTHSAFDGFFMILFSCHKGHISPRNRILSVEPLGGLLTQSCMCACASDSPLDIRNRQFSSNRHHIIPLLAGTSCCVCA
ncbi:hypothetical protein Pcinc_035166 [Petrolisthes cinctipes]|uniref:Uncharacterized protein n=1 Tax=Petrolisthes cinctipes TaxID=88211 RepID=A0AAE1EPJ0_PETCI|nr:hypothetical protein Pcinc_035166 [Petrolisthes cinctipes]